MQRFLIVSAPKFRKSRHAERFRVVAGGRDIYFYVSKHCRALSKQCAVPKAVRQPAHQLAATASCSGRQRAANRQVAAKRTAMPIVCCIV